MKANPGEFERICKIPKVFLRIRKKPERIRVSSSKNEQKFEDLTKSEKILEESERIRENSTKF